MVDGGLFINLNQTFFFLSTIVIYNLHFRRCHVEANKVYMVQELIWNEIYNLLDLSNQFEGQMFI